MSWFNTDGNLSENILFSKFTYTRNIAGVPFAYKNTEKTATVIARAEALLKKNGFRIQQIQKNNKLLALSYCEKQYVDSDFCSYAGERAIFFNEPCSLSVSFGGANLINIYAILPGACIRDAHKISSSAEHLLDSEFDFAYDKNIGYLSPFEHLCGSGTRISCALYLPCLSAANKLGSVCAALANCNISVYPIFSNKDFGDIYIMSYSPPRGESEDDAVNKFDKFMLEIVNLEKEELKAYNSATIFNIAERASRALGSLSYSGYLSEADLISYTSQLRLCISAGCKNMLPQSIDTTVLNSILFEGLSASLIANSKKEINSSPELDAYRAEFVRRTLQALPKQTAMSACT